MSSQCDKRKGLQRADRNTVSIYFEILKWIPSKHPSFCQGHCNVLANPQESYIIFILTCVRRSWSDPHLLFIAAKVIVLGGACPAVSINHRGFSRDQHWAGCIRKRCHFLFCRILQSGRFSSCGNSVNFVCKQSWLSSSPDVRQIAATCISQVLAMSILHFL